MPARDGDDNDHDGQTAGAEAMTNLAMTDLVYFGIWLIRAGGMMSLVGVGVVGLAVIWSAP